MKQNLDKLAEEVYGDTGGINTEVSDIRVLPGDHWKLSLTLPLDEVSDVLGVANEYGYGLLIIRPPGVGLQMAIVVVRNRILEIMPTVRVMLV